MVVVRVWVVGVEKGQDISYNNMGAQRLGREEWNNNDPKTQIIVFPTKNDGCAT